ncbi:MAG TPA: hypothetical protein VN238_14430 [Solirubrobacteraceae bacterium]|nr:hypothetical protein [Solirubrobacteraceae bacterium]
MEQVARLIDADVASLSARVHHAVERAGSGCSVTRFTYWYTGRPPVHEALVLRAPQPSSSADR